MSIYEQVMATIREKHGNIVADRVSYYYNDDDVNYINTLSEEEATDYIKGDLDQVILYMELAEETSALA